MPQVNAQKRANTLAEITAMYHLAVNQEVDDKLRQLKSVLIEMANAETTTRRNALREKHFQKLSEAECLSKEGKTENLSVFCLGTNLNNFKQEFSKTVYDYTQASTNQTSQAEAVIDQAELVLAKTINAYGQIMTSEIYHQENKLAINAAKDLSSYLEAMEDEISLLPIKFTNVSTTKCQ
jgi:hypothetical protein